MPSKHRNKPEKQRRRAPREERAEREAFTYTEEEIVSAEESAALAAPAAPVNAWKCKCGATVSGKFCPECGSPRPVDTEGWTCSCGTINKGKFCAECGKPKPAGALQYRCDKCGWEVPKDEKPPKFCPECGDPFDDADIVR